MSFKDKVILVSGASSGIGAVTAIEFAKEGAKVAIVGRKVEKLERVARECEKYGPKPLVIKADITYDAEAKKMVEKVIETFKKLDILINNAASAKLGTILDGNMIESYEETMNINLRSHIHVTSLAVPHLIKTKGNIVNISSVAGSTVPKHRLSSTAYVISKAALNHFSKCAAKELASVGIRVNIMSPGPTITDMLENTGVTEYKFEDMAVHMPLKRVSESKEMADVILFLASDKAVGITGSEYAVDNGYLLVN